MQLLIFLAAALCITANAQLFGPPPPEAAQSGTGRSLLEVVCSTPDLEQLCDVMRSLPPNSPIAAELDDPSFPATLFAPSNDAFAKDAAEVIDTFRLPSLQALEQTPAASSRLIENHIIAGVLQQPQLTNGLELRAVGGETLRISTGWIYGKFVESSGSSAGFVGGRGDIPAGSIIIHVIDGVLLPRL